MDPWILIAITFLEILFLVIPALIASKVEHKSFKQELREMGFSKSSKPKTALLIKILAGLSLGFIFFLIGGYIATFFRVVIIEGFGIEVVKEGEEGAIQTAPTQPNLLQVIIIVALQIIIIAPCEEGFFRGFILKKIRSNTSLFYAILISSTFFAIYHVPPFLVPLTTIITFFGYYFTFGVLLAIIYVNFDNSLIPCSVAHAFFNILILLF